MRRGPGRGFLVLGRMLKAQPLVGVKTVEWTYEGKQRAIPAVFHGAWETLEGGFAVAVAVERSGTDPLAPGRLRSERSP